MWVPRSRESSRMPKRAKPTKPTDSGDYALFAIGREVLGYREGQMEAHIIVERGLPNRVYLDTRSLEYWQPPFQHLRIPEDKQQEIIGRIVAILTRQGADVVLDEFTG